jgi:hypothetical protein
VVVSFSLWQFSCDLFKTLNVWVNFHFFFHTSVILIYFFHLNDYTYFWHIVLAVPIAVIASFRKTKKLTRDYSLIAAALRESSFLVIFLFSFLFF